MTTESRDKRIAELEGRLALAEKRLATADKMLRFQDRGWFSLDRYRWRVDGVYFDSFEAALDAAGEGEGESNG
jgi:hypothetical protein